MSSTLLRQTPKPTVEPDREAGRLFEEHSNRIYAFCLRRLGCPSDAEDAVQTTFLYAHRALQRGVVPESESAWLFAIAKNVCRSQHRTVARRGPESGAVDVDSVASPEPFDDGHETLDGLENALATMPDRQRHALLLREWRGLSSSEIASLLGLSGPATYALLTRARRSLAQAMTAASRPALGIASLVYELRSHLKAFFGGVTAKGAVTAAVAVAVTVTVGGVSAGGARGEDRPPAAPASSSDAAAAPGTASVDAAGGAASLGSSALGSRGNAPRVAAPASAQSVQLASGTTPAPNGAVEAGGPPEGSALEGSAPPSGTSARAADLDGILSETVPDPDLPPLPELELPPVPDVELPPLPDGELPPVPDVELPPVPDLEAPVEAPGDVPLDPPLDPGLGLPLDVPAAGEALGPPSAPEDLLP